MNKKILVICAVIGTLFWSLDATAGTKTRTVESTCPDLGHHVFNDVTEVMYGSPQISIATKSGNIYFLPVMCIHKITEDN